MQIATKSPPPLGTGARPGEAWFVVVMLCLFITASFVDRNILAVLVGPIRADLGISDKSIGLLFGLGFALFYVCFGVPLAHLADRGNRKRLLLIGVTLWSCTTLASAFAANLAMLAVARAGVAIGEAVLTPIAISLIADLFAPEKRSLPTSINLIAGALMASGSAVLGGGAYALAQWAAVPFGIAPWRMTFVIVALPGLILAAIFALGVREPPRLDDGDTPDAGHGMADVFRYFFANFPFYGMSFIGVGILASVGNALVAWGPTLLVREHGLIAARAGAAFGAAAFTGVALGSVLVPLILRRTSGAVEVRRILFAMVAFPAATLPVMALTLGSPSLVLTLVGVGVGMAGIVSGPIFAPLLVQAAAPGRFRARMTAIYLVFNILIAVGLGPLVVPIVDAWPGMTLGGSLALIGWAVLALALACYGAAIVGAQARWRRALPADEKAIRMPKAGLEQRS